MHDSAEIREKVAVVVDVRLGDSFARLPYALDELKKMNCEYKVLFVDADNDVILRRYQETRRKHPLASADSSRPLQEIIAHERELIKDVRDMADFVIDSSFFSTSQIKERVAKLFLDDVTITMKVSVVSFGFKYGSPKDSDLVFDVRCLPNPFYVPELKYQTGLDKPVEDFIMSFDEAKNLESKLLDLITYLVPLYRSEGKSQLTISVGCTGGKHRSVLFAERIYKEIKKNGFNVSVHHRDIQR